MNSMGLPSPTAARHYGPSVRSPRGRAFGWARIDAERFLRTLRELAKVGADPLGGISRLGLSTEESEACRYIGALSRRAGLAARVDPAGNLLVQRPQPDPSLPVLMFGSHLDSVRQGGWLDGAYGTVAAVEALIRLVETGAPAGRFEPVAVGFANEEGALVQYPFWGSRAIAGLLDDGARAACDRQERSAEEFLRAAGGDPERLAEAAWPAGRIAAFLELHIEQGPVLELQGRAIGVVDRIVGRTVFECEIKGEQRHAGTTPMGGRRDALAAAARLVTKVERIATELGACATATVGFLSVEPNTTNTIPGIVRLTAEIRDPDPARLRLGEKLLTSMSAHVAMESGTEITLRVSDRSAPVATDPALRAAVGRAADSLGLTRLTMPSGAGHDAQIIAAVAPVGMIFVPSKAGMSHAPSEDTDPAALVAGADVLLATIVALQQGAPTQLSKVLPHEGVRNLQFDCIAAPGAWIERVLSQDPQLTAEALSTAVRLVTRQAAAEGLTAADLLAQAVRRLDASPADELEETRSQLAGIACLLLDSWLAS